MNETDHPLYEVAEQAGALIQAGHTVHQKFTCARCGSRQTMGEPNIFFVKGKCEECGHETDLRVRGCNYIALLDLPGADCK